MQSLWSRARTVTNSCRCSLCNPPRSAISRRATTAPAPRRHGGNDAITVFYGTVMAAALWTDAASKIGQRKRLDKALKSTQGDVEALERANTQRLQALGIENTLESEDKELPKEVAKSEPRKKKRLRKREEWMAENPSSQRTTSGDYRPYRPPDGFAGYRPSEESSTALHGFRQRTAANKSDKKVPVANHEPATTDTSEKNTSAKSQLPTLWQTLEDGPTEAWPVGRSAEQLWQTPFFFRRNTYWIRRGEHAMAILILRLIRMARRQNPDFVVDLGVDETHPLHISKLTTDELEEELVYENEQFQRIRALARHRREATFVERPTFLEFRFHSYKDSAYDEQRLRQLNTAICNTFATSTDSWETLAEIINILTNFQTFPNIHTFNILLTNLARIGIYETKSLYVAMIECGITQNELSMAALLRHSSVSDEDLFQRLVDGIEVKDGKGHITLGPSTSELAQQYPELLTDHYWTRKKRTVDPTDDFLSHWDWDKQKQQFLRFPLTIPIYEALVSGFVERSEPQRALHTISTLKASGLKMTAKILNALLWGRSDQGAYPFPVQEMQDQLLAGEVDGTKDQLKETIFLLHDYWLSLSANEKGTATIAIKALNQFAGEQDLLLEPLQRHKVQALSQDDYHDAWMKSRWIRQLETPVLNLHFEHDRVVNLTKACPSIEYAEQPKSLMEFAEERLLSLVDHFEEQHGPYIPFRQNDTPNATQHGSREDSATEASEDAESNGIIGGELLVDRALMDEVIQTHKSHEAEPAAQSAQQTCSDMTDRPGRTESAKLRDQQMQAYQGIRDHRWLAEIPVIPDHLVARASMKAR